MVNSMTVGNSEQILYANFNRAALKQGQNDSQNDTLAQRYRLLSESSGVSTYEYHPEEDLLYYTICMSGKGLLNGILEDARRSCAGMVHPDSGRDALGHYSRACRKACEGSFCCRLLSPESHEYRWCLVRYRSLADRNGKVTIVVGSIFDVDDLKQKELHRHTLEKAFTSLVSPDAFLSLCFDIRSGRRIVSQSDKLPKGFDRPDSLKQFLKEVRSDVFPRELPSFLELFDGEQMENADINCSHRMTLEFRSRGFGSGSEYRWMRAKAFYTHNPGSDSCVMLLVISDIDDSKRREKEERRQPKTDTLTGLLTRDAFENKVSLLRQGSSKRQAQLVLMSLPGFEELSRQTGYERMNQILRDTGERISILLRPDDCAGRIDAKTFCLFLTDDMTDETDKRIRIIKNILEQTVAPSVVPKFCAGAVRFEPGMSLGEAEEQAKAALANAEKPDESGPVYYAQVQTIKETDDHEIKPKDKHTAITEQTEVVIRTFGYFDMFVDGKAVVFNHEKAKELLALLVDRQGGYVSSKEAVGYLWEDEPANRVTLSRYRKVAMWLNELLAQYGIQDIIEIENGSRRIVSEKVDCDLFKFLSDEPRYAKLYKGSYLQNYSWGEMTVSTLSHRQIDSSTKYNQT